MNRNNFTVNLTNTVDLPDIDYVNELAAEKGFIFGKNFLTVPKILEDLYYLFRECAKDPEHFDQKNHLFSRKYLEDDVLLTPLNDSQVSYFNYTLKFLTEMDFNAVPGVTPLDKALNTVLFITHLSSTTNKENHNPTGNSKKTTVQNEEDLAKAIKDVSAGVQTDETSSINTEAENNGLKKEMTKCVRDHLYDLSPAIAHIYGKKRPADVPINKRILNDIAVKSYLENSKGLETADSTIKKRNNDSNEREKLHMEEHGQITKVNKQAMAMETFDDKFIKKELIVKEKVKPETKKQMLYMLLDDSGSMGNLTKQTYVRAVLLNRLESVIAGKSSLKFALYESERYMEFDVKDKTEARKVFNTIALRSPQGGGTNIGYVLQQTIDDVYDVPGHCDPEIMIVCDGDDFVDPESVDLKGVRINAILLGRENPGIEALTKKSEGFYTVEAFYN